MPSQTGQQQPAQTCSHDQYSCAHANKALIGVEAILGGALLFLSERDTVLIVVVRSGT